MLCFLDERHDIDKTARFKNLYPIWINEYEPSARAMNWRIHFDRETRQFVYIYWRVRVINNMRLIDTHSLRWAAVGLSIEDLLHTIVNELQSI